MRLDAPDSSWHVVMRGPDELNGGDFKTLQATDDELSGADRGIGWATEKDADGKDMDVAYVLSADGTSMVPRKVNQVVTRAVIDRGRNNLLRRLIKSWSLSDLEAEPWTDDRLEQDDVPLELYEAVEKVLTDVRSRLRAGGPKAPPSGSSEAASSESSVSAPA